MGSWYSIGEFLEDLLKLSESFECDEDFKKIDELVKKFKYYYFNKS